MTKEKVESDRQIVREEILSLHNNWRDEWEWPDTLDKFIDFYYDRPETDEEMDARQESDAVYIRNQENRDRATYNRLKKRFG